jgi:integrase/recombinase XerD
VVRRHPAHAYSGVRFFFINAPKRDWHIFTYLKSKREQRLPCILDREDAFRLLGCINTFHNYACLATVYACGLRISEALALQVTDIDGKRMMIHVHRGKGAKDRYVPLPPASFTGRFLSAGKSSLQGL